MRESKERKGERADWRVWRTIQVKTRWLLHITLDLSFGMFKENIGMSSNVTLFEDRVAGGR